jgi:hypothetical protein
MALPSLRTRKLYHPTGRQSFAMMLDCVVDLNAAKKGEYVSCPRISRISRAPITAKGMETA